MGHRRHNVQWHPCLAFVHSTDISQVATQWRGSSQAENIGMERSTTWSTWFHPTRGHSPMEETDVPTSVGIEYHVRSHKQEQAGMAGGNERETGTQSVGASPRSSSVKNARHPGIGGTGEQMEIHTGPIYITIKSSSL